MTQPSTIEPAAVTARDELATRPAPPIGAGRGRRGLRVLAALIAAAVGLLLAGLILTPFVFLVRTSLSTGFPLRPEGPTLANYAEALGSGGIPRLMLNSGVYALGVCVVALTIGGTLAWVGERTNAPLRSWLLPIGLLPLAIPGVLFTLSFVLLLAPRTGLLNQLVAAVSPLEGLLNIYSLPGMILVEGAQASSLAYLMASGYLRSVDSSLEEAARIAGAGVLRTLRRVTMPLGAPTLLGVLLLIFVRAIESFETPALIGIPAGIPVFTSRIFLAIRESPPEFGLGSAFSMFLVVVTSVGVLLYSRLLRRGNQFVTVTGKGGAHTLLDLGPWRWAVTGGVLVYAGLVVVLPVLVLLWTSLLPSFAVPSAEALAQAGLDNYRSVIGRSDFRGAITNTAVLALGTAVLVSLVALTLAWVVVRVRVRGVWLVDAVATVPLVIPGVVMGMAFLTLALDVPVGLYGTLTILLMLHLTRFLPYGMRTATAGLLQIDRELEEAAVMSGARWARRMRKILLPLVLPTLIGGALYTALLSVRELSGSILVYSVDTRLFSILIYDYFQNGEFGLLSAAGFMVIAVLAVVVWLLRRTGVLGTTAR